jgi:hypothetical protein
VVWGEELRTVLGTDVARRLIALLRIVERTAGDHADVATDDALLDAWFGCRAPAIGPDTP